jgi:hypothetical protein
MQAAEWSEEEWAIWVCPATMQAAEWSEEEWAIWVCPATMQAAEWSEELRNQVERSDGLIAHSQS